MIHHEAQPAGILSLSLFKSYGVGLFDLLLSGLRHFASNWVRLTLLAIIATRFNRPNCQVCWFADLLAWILAILFGLCLGPLFCSFLIGRVGCNHLRPHKSSKPIAVAMVCLLLCSQGSAMQMSPQTETERQRCLQRDGTALVATRAIKKQTRDRRKIYLHWFRSWLWNEKQLSFRFLIDQKPADPERLAGLLGWLC